MRNVPSCCLGILGSREPSYFLEFGLLAGITYVSFRIMGKDGRLQRRFVCSSFWLASELEVLWISGHLTAVTLLSAIQFYDIYVFEDSYSIWFLRLLHTNFSLSLIWRENYWFHMKESQW